ncbi:MerR-like DNA binding protein [Krasilnikovia cinnamomea]|uniref:MerR-like DNA binding protein n=1 Tax=Krasilnikovia cinnamomea TaxID=349313 RepID=A0A4Q7Z8B9_9ACTN|nr:MerR family transcriptional regulator [Krasilnikovia cinnamomea]RZU46698.1 MerR-like DNA binding protein [Krasilnikovia cinnamomea]
MRLLRIGELAQQAGVSTRTVDYYTSLGLLQPAERTDGGYRLYHPATADTIDTIRQLETHGISLDAIADAINHHGRGDLTTTLAHLADGLTALQETAHNAPHAQALLTLISSRAHALIDLAQTIVDSPIV